MPGWAYGIPAAECKTGSKLVDVKGSTCEGCYALKGCYISSCSSSSIRRLKAIDHPLWVRAMAALINSKKSKYFRWHDSGDVQSLKHLAKILKLQAHARRKHWLPTREAWTQRYQDRAPSNLTIRFSMPMVDQPAAGNWNNTSTVVSGSGEHVQHRSKITNVKIAERAGILLLKT
jgi:hypothetical protein